MNGRRVLIIDDDPSVTDTLAKQLQGQGAIPEIAASYQDGIAALKKSVPDVAIVDLMLPEHSGIQLIQEMQHLAGKTFFVILTNSMNAESLAKSAGVEIPLILQKAEHDPAEIVRLIAEKLPA
jgi:DNA-binding response OmpR family regulator